MKFAMHHYTDMIACFLNFPVISDRIRPACLPLTPAHFDDRISYLFRIVRVDSSNIVRASALKAIKYDQIETQMCAFLLRIGLSEQTAFCGNGDGELGAEGDPIVVKVKGTQQTAPVYQVGLNIFKTNGKLAVFLHLHPYVQWIDENINELEKQRELQYQHK